jgi:hypothetical protein
VYPGVNFKIKDILSLNTTTLNLPMKFLMPLLLFACANGHPQTCIIAKIENRDIIIGADSRLGRIPLKGIAIESFDTACKINIHENFYFAIAGVSVTKLAAQYLNEYPKKNVNVNEILQYLKERLTKPIYLGLDTIRKDSNQLYIDYLKRPILQILFAYHKKNIPKIFFIEFRATKIINDSTFETSPELIMGNPLQPLVIGHVDYINNTSFLYNDYIWRNGATEAIKTLIKVVADSTRYVGLPLVLIKIKRYNYECIEKIKECTLCDTISTKESGNQLNKSVIE